MSSAPGHPPANHSSQRILLATITDWTGIARLPALLARLGVAVEAIGPPGCRLLQSSWVQPHPLQGNDPVSWTQQILTFVKTQGARFHWLCAVDDELVLQLQPHQSLPEAQRLLPVTGQGLDFLVSKFAFPVLAARNGLPVPRTFAHRDRDQLLTFAQKIGFPLLVKREVGTAGRSVFRADDPVQLQTILAGLTQDRALALQQFIHGRVFGATAVWFRGTLLAWLGFEKIRCHPDAFGPACVIRLCAPADMEVLLQQLGRVSGFHGLGGADFMRDENGRLLLLEQHPRPNSQFLFAAQAGVDLLGALRALIAGRGDFPLQRPEIAEPRWLPMFPQEAERQLAAKQWGALRRWLLSSRYGERIPWDDPDLLTADLARLQRLHGEQS